MIEVINVTFPLFALIFIGYLSRVIGIMGESASSELNKFVIYLGLPSLLFVSIVKADLSLGGEVRFLISYVASMLSVFMCYYFYAVSIKKEPVHGIIEALGASYANTGFMGIPLCILVFGTDGILPAMIATIMTACLLFGITVVMIEIMVNKGNGTINSINKVGKSLIKNPIIVAPALGFIVTAIDHDLPGGVIELFSILGDASVPCALISIGLFLRSSHKVQSSSVKTLVFFKLIIHPAITAFFVFYIFNMPLVYSFSALLLSALPIGTGPYMIAALYNEEIPALSKAILFSTLLSILTISGVLWVYFNLVGTV